MKIVFGPNAYALSDWMATSLGEDYVVRLHGKTTPEPRHRMSDFCVINDDEWWGHDFENFMRLIDPSEKIDVIMAGFVSQSALLVADRTMRSQIETNIEAYLDIVQAVLPHMIRARYGRFVYLSSFRSVTPTKGAVLYGACKAFGEALFAGINEEYKDRNIKAYSLRLGYLDGGLQGPRPDDVQPLSPVHVTDEIERCLSGFYQSGRAINRGDHR